MTRAMTGDRGDRVVIRIEAAYSPNSPNSACTVGQSL